jgi:Tol biopolymer transport system component
MSDGDLPFGRRLVWAGVGAAVFVSGALLAIATRAGGQPVGAVPRILYASDWSGSGQIYSVDPSGRGRGQLTFGRAPLCPTAAPCGFDHPVPSPDGRWVLFWDGGVQESKSNVYVARADGSHRRVIGRLNSRFVGDAVWSPDSRSISYTRVDGIHVLGVDGSDDRRVSTNGDDSDPAWSPDGKSFAFVRNSGSASDAHRQIVVVRAGRRQLVGRSTTGALRFQWSPTGAQIAYELDTSVFVVRPDGRLNRRISESAVNFAWSADGRSLAFSGRLGLEVADVAKGSIAVVGFYGGRVNAWSPRGHLLAFDGFDGGLRVRDAAGRVRRVSRETPAVLAWSPDSTMLAYVTATSSDLKVVTLSGKARTVVSAAGDEGGWISGLVWTQPPGGLRYRPPEPRLLATVTSDGIETRWPVERLAADGLNVAYVACGHTFVWTPDSKLVVQSEPNASLSPNCPSASYYTSYRVYGLALAGSRLVVANVQGSNGRSWWMGEGGIRPGTPVSELGHDRSTNGGPYYGTLLGDPTGSGNVLVFGAWMEAFSAGPGSPIATTSEEIRRAAPGGCPCTTIAPRQGR